MLLSELTEGAIYTHRKKLQNVKKCHKQIPLADFLDYFVEVLKRQFLYQVLCSWSGSKKVFLEEKSNIAN